MAEIVNDWKPLFSQKVPSYMLVPQISYSKISENSRERNHGGVYAESCGPEKIRATNFNPLMPLVVFQLSGFHHRCCLRNFKNFFIETLWTAASKLPGFRKIQDHLPLVHAKEEPFLIHKNITEFNKLYHKRHKQKLKTNVRKMR